MGGDDVGSGGGSGRHPGSGPDEPPPALPIWSPGAVVVVGAGVAGLACARRLHDAGVEAVVLDRGRRPGGRLGLRTSGAGTVAGRPVDVGASYLVPRDAAFAAQAEDWRRRGLAAPWTDTFTTLAREGGHVVRGTAGGPQRWSAPGGLRTLAQDLADGLVADGVDVATAQVRRVDRAPGTATSPGALLVDGRPCRAVVLAMPEPQAVRLAGPAVAPVLAPLRERAWEPVITVWARWAERWWPAMHGAFVNGSTTVDFVADDGRRRRDGAPVLVAHSSSAVARQHLGDPDAAVGPVLAELADLLGGDAPPAPLELGAQRWTFARPATPHEEPFLLQDGIGVCGDAWGGRPGVEQAWLSGAALGAALAARVAAPGGRT